MITKEDRWAHDINQFAKCCKHSLERMKAIYRARWPEHTLIFDEIEREQKEPQNDH